MRKITWITLCLFALTALGACKIKSQGESLEEVKKAGKASVGTTHALTLSQINIEIDRTGLYLRAFDKAYQTIFIYFPDSMKNKIANLKPNEKYIYKFKVTKNDKFSTLSGELLEVADTEGNPIANNLLDQTVLVRTIRLDGRAAVGKTYRVNVDFQSKGEDGDKKYAYFRVKGYPFSVWAYYGDDKAAEVDKLENHKTYNLEIKVTDNGITIKGDLIAIK